MKIRSFCRQTDLIFHRFEGRITDRGKYLVIETPSNPGFFWGNLLLFEEAPTCQDHLTWKELFRKEFAHNPLVKHMTFAWDDTDGQVGEAEVFINEGFIIERSVTMSATQVRAPLKYNDNIKVRDLKSHDDWEQAYENQVRCRQDDSELESHRAFKRNQMAQYRRMSDAGLGHWFGAFLGGRLVADLGIFRDHSLGRFQNVETHPDFRRQGICGALVHRSAEYALNEMGIEKLVIVADPEDHPARIYSAVGFNEIERCAGMHRNPG